MNANRVVPKKLQRILDETGHRWVRTLTQKRCLHQRGVFEKIKGKYSETLLLCAQMFERADTQDITVCLEPHDPRWKKAGLDDFCEEEHILIRRVCEKAGYPIALNSDGLIVPPRIRTRPALVLMAQAS